MSPEPKHHLSILYSHERLKITVFSFSETAIACSGLTLCPSSFSLLILSTWSGDRPGQRKQIYTRVLPAIFPGWHTMRKIVLDIPLVMLSPTPRYALSSFTERNILKKQFFCSWNREPVMELSICPMCPKLPLQLPTLKGSGGENELPV